MGAARPAGAVVGRAGGPGPCGWLRAAGDLPGPVLAGVVADAELAVAVVAPAPQGGAGADGAGLDEPAVMLAQPPGAGVVTCRGRSWLACADAELSRRRWRPSTRGCAPVRVAQVCEPPAVTLAQPPGAGVVTCRGRSWSAAVADAELAVVVAAPAPQGGRRCGWRRCDRRGGDAGPAARRRGGDLPGPVLAGGVAGAELAVAVVAPAPQGAASAGGAGVDAAGGDAGPAPARGR